MNEVKKEVRPSSADSEAVDTAESCIFQSGRAMAAGTLPAHGYESPQVGLPYPAFHETEDERKSRLSGPRIAEARRRLLPDS